MSDYLPIGRREGVGYPLALLRIQDEWGLKTADLVTPPSRLLSAKTPPAPVVDQGVEIKRIKAVPTPADLLLRLPEGDTWAGQSRRTLARILACFIVAEDPQRRLEAREVSTLCHQVSLVRHVLDNEKLRRVLVADEVGLGKTVEVGLVLKELLERTPQLRVLYLAPARLVTNVRREFDKMRLGFRQWSSNDGDARLTDNRIIASIHRAVHARHAPAILATEPWDVVVVDECHHLSDWAQGGGDPREKFKLVRDLLERQGQSGRVLLLSGTPHQGHESRFENLISLLLGKNEPREQLAGRVIYRTKDDVRDWDGNPLFPRRHVKEPLVVDLGVRYKEWITHIHDFFRPTGVDAEQSNRRRAAGWRCAQALQWAASSPQAGVGYLVRQAIRAGWKLDDEVLRESVAALRPYRGGRPDENIDQLFSRMVKDIRQQDDDDDLDDIDASLGLAFDDESDELRQLLREGLQILADGADVKWQIIKERILDSLEGEKAVLFAQPIETVTAFASYLERVTGQRPAIIIGGQSDAERDKEVAAFNRIGGPQFLVSSRAGGEGINLQISRRLIHIDVPWNPMDMEQRVGRVHRFGSKRTILVDTLVVKDSREEHAYRVARDKLRSITATMVEPERFEQVFSRVMSLVPPEELLNVLSNSPLAPLTDGDQEVIAKVVREGFAAWQDFDRRFAESQKLIRSQEPGLTTWKDVADFLQLVSKWSIAEGFVKQKFTWVEGELESLEESALVLRSPDGGCYACGDQGGIPVYGPDESRAEQLGLNLPEVRDLIHAAAFPAQATGAYYLKWNQDLDLGDLGVLGERFYTCIFLRQAVRTDPQGGWQEAGVTLHAFVSESLESMRPVEGDHKRKLIKGLLSSTPRVKAPPADLSADRLHELEASLWNNLRRPSAEEITSGIRYAVWPIALGIVDFEK